MNKKILFFSLAAAFLLLICSTSFALAANGVPLVPQQCNPTRFGGCTVADFAQLVKNIITWGRYIVFPIATFFIGWGGFMILTSGGNTEKVSEGKKKIKIAVIGLLIALLATLAVQMVFRALDVQDRGFPTP